MNLNTIFSINKWGRYCYDSCKRCMRLNVVFKLLLGSLRKFPVRLGWVAAIEIKRRPSLANCHTKVRVVSRRLGNTYLESVPRSHYGGKAAVPGHREPSWCGVPVRQLSAITRPLPNAGKRPFKTAWWSFHSNKPWRSRCRAKRWVIVWLS